MPIADLPRRAALLAALIGAPGLPAAAEDVPVDLELVLAVDISGSVDEVEALLQREGYMAALRHPQVIEAVENGMFGSIAVTYVEWAGDYYQHTMLGWTQIDGQDSAHAFADALGETPLMTAHWTSLSGAIDYAVPLFDDNGFEGFRRVIDISGLPIVNDRPNPWGGRPPIDLDLYYEQRVIGGPGAFIVVAEDYTSFASAILSKLLLEIAGETPPAGRVVAAAR
jgi:hypothetical protein